MRLGGAPGDAKSTSRKPKPDSRPKPQRPPGDLVPIEGQSPSRPEPAVTSGIDKTIDSGILPDHEIPKADPIQPDIGSDFDDLDDLVIVGEMGTAPNNPPRPIDEDVGDLPDLNPKSESSITHLPMAEPAESSAEQNDLLGNDFADLAELDDLVVDVDLPTASRQSSKTQPSTANSQTGQSVKGSDKDSFEKLISDPVEDGAEDSFDEFVDEQDDEPGNQSANHPVEDSFEDNHASFEVLDDSDEDIIDLSDGDIVVGLAPPAGADLGKIPTQTSAAAFPSYPQQSPAPQPAYLPANETGTVVSAAPAPQPVTAQPTPTSMNPAYRPFGPPPAAHYPNEPIVPDGPNSSAPGAGASGFVKQRNHNSGASVEAILSIIVGLLATVFGLWVAFNGFQVVSSFLSGGQGAGRLTGQAGILLFLFGFRMLAGLGMLIGSSLFLINEVMRLNGTDPMPYSCMTALIAGCFYLVIQFGVTCYQLFNITAVVAYGIASSGSIFVILVLTFLGSLIPIALIVMAALRRR